MFYWGAGVALNKRPQDRNLRTQATMGETTDPSKKSGISHRWPVAALKTMRPSSASSSAIHIGLPLRGVVSNNITPPTSLYGSSPARRPGESDSGAPNPQQEGLRVLNEYVTRLDLV
jgi:hypothetical protein